MKQQAEYLSLPELAKRMSLCIKTIRTFIYVADDPLPIYRLPKKILINVKEFDRWFARFKVTHRIQDLDALVKELTTDL